MIDIGEKYYPPERFGVVWAQLQPALESGQIRMIRSGIVELRRRNDAWRQPVIAACSRHAADESAAAVQGVFARLTAAIDGGTLTRKLSEIDLLVLACGEAAQLPVVTGDTRIHNAIRDGHCAVRPLWLWQLFGELGWTFN
ncbi:MAG: hypothetical protein JO036_19470 [Candidatus Eremiobacteraeota bacterium]|nr:hypothetical protein [Candidatus Eremiobacteraeota bacterium]